mmetsp:Transcript_29005/g.59475  ORF Transcript_29005/g.59475 Transcript_29005/m.59475 type:complete len:310 (+) Transcript_29005:127-1056(+)
MSKSSFAEKVKIPEPILNLCSKNVLVMEYLSGKKLAVSIEEKLAAILGGDISAAIKVLKATQQSLDEESSLFFRVNVIIEESRADNTRYQKGLKAFQLLSMTRDARNKLSLLLDATGHQIFHDGIYNGDCHPGNILVLDDGLLGLIDYGQTRRLSHHDRLALARVVSSLGKRLPDAQEVADAMRKFGFRSRDDNVEIIAKNASLYFNSDIEGKRMGFATPQKYLQYLNSKDPMLHVPDPAVFVARTSFLFRGLGALLQQQIHTSPHWRKHAILAVAKNGKAHQLYNLGLTPISNDKQKILVSSQIFSFP